MATSVPAPSKPAARKAAPAPRKKVAAEPKGGTPLQFRYHTIMKPQRVYALVVEVPRSRREEEDGAVVVVRPIIAGAVVVPPEQRLDTSEAGNQVIFHVTPLARGRLPRARVEVHAAGHAPQDVLLPMKAKTQRLAWFLLLFAFLMTWLIWRTVKDDWKVYEDQRSEFQKDRKEIREKNENDFFADRGTAYAEKVTDDVSQDWIKVPFFNVPFEPEENDKGSSKFERFTLVEEAKKPLAVGYAGLLKGVAKYRWLPVIFAVLLLLAFLSWSFHRPRSVRVRRRLTLGPAAEPAGEPPILQPL